MNQLAKTTITLLVLVLGVGVAGAWGWQALITPFPKSEEPPLCVETPIAAGSKVYPDEITVSVLNASKRAGLASRTRGLFIDKGFGAGTLGNAPSGTDVTNAEVWVDDPAKPGALLVRSYLGKRTVIRESTTVGPGVTVVVGEKFSGLRKGRKLVTAEADTTVCTAPDSAAEPNP